MNSHIVPTPSARFRVVLRRPFVATAATLVILAMAVTYGHQRFGSPRAAWAYARGERILIDGRTQDLGEVRSGETRKVRYALTNLSSRPVRILGSRMSCTCTVAESLPEACMPGGKTIIRLDFSPSPSMANQTVDEIVRLFTDEANNPELVLTFTARVTEPRGELERQHR